MKQKNSNGWSIGGAVLALLGLLCTAGGQLPHPLKEVVAVNCAAVLTRSAVVWVARGVGILQRYPEWQVFSAMGIVAAIVGLFLYGPLRPSP